MRTKVNLCDITVYLACKYSSNEIKNIITISQYNFISIALATVKFVEKLMECHEPKFMNNYLINNIVNLPLQIFIPANSFLYKIKLKDSMLCTFYKTNEEISEHSFYSCRVTHQFCECFHNCILNKTDFLLGYFKESNLPNILFLLQTKVYL